MNKSSLTNYEVPANSSNFARGREGNKVKKITIHHMAGVLTSQECGYIFQKPNRQASSNYGIGNNGDIAIYVSEDDRAWTSSNKANDIQAITIEVSNSFIGGDYPVSDKAFNSLVNLCVDICNRYGFRLNYTGDKNGSLTRHNMFAATACPGKYLQDRFQQIADLVNSKLDGGIQPQPQEMNKEMFVKVNTALNVRNGAGTNYPITRSLANGTKVIVKQEFSGWSRISANEWVASSYLVQKEVPQPSSGYSLGKYVVNVRTALNVRNAPINGAVVKTYANGPRFDTFEIQGSWARTPSGWVCLDYCNLVYKY